MEPLPVQPQATDLDTLWRQFVRAESHKRTAYGTYQCDAMWYQTFSRPRLVSHLEIKHDLPCPEEQWQAKTPEEWAHASLLKPFKPIRYIDAIRATLKPESSAELAAFGSSGLLCVLLFILTSVREVSGWATMSGRLCADRFEVSLGFEYSAELSDPSRESNRSGAYHPSPSSRSCLCGPRSDMADDCSGTASMVRPAYWRTDRDQFGRCIGSCVSADNGRTLAELTNIERQ